MPLVARSLFATVGLTEASESRNTGVAAAERTAPVQRRDRRAFSDAPRQTESAAGSGGSNSPASRRERVARGARVAAGQPLAHGHVPGAGVQRAPAHLGNARHENLIAVVVVRDVSTRLLLLLLDGTRGGDGALVSREELRGE